MGVRGGVEEELASRAGVPFRAIESGQVRGMALWVAARNLLKAGRGVIQAGRLIAEFQLGDPVSTRDAFRPWRRRTRSQRKPSKD